ncbi:dihydroorotate oxidase B, catalytic subunit [Granulicatella balaenopterae]|uniref:Dihydroorotate dehydrogenase n=1 Tax=Granulicatella balaenopterae TaxID=137733 RepID=A0A1H9P0I0_9LACT|nr:dihydroorotate oxidase [Granulicatella balaenopterae]SER41567.1 dihydroorotate oxidase B, catalytic subunit [Granulicatella balaenopterae]
MVLLNTTIAGYEFDNCLMNAAGVCCYDHEELTMVDQSSAGTFVTKSATKTSREGNPLPRYQAVPLGSINSMGLPNLGLDYYLDYVRQLEKQTKKTYFLSMTGLSKEETLEMLKQVELSDFKGMVELNLSCPNVPGKPQLAYDLPTTENLLTEVFAFFTKPLGVKLPPYFDIAHFDAAAEVYNKFPLAFVNCVNSIGNGLIINDETVVIKPKNGFGGIGGDYIKPTALANVHAFYQRLKPSIKIIGTGGVKTGRDVFEHILCGASMVQVGTALEKEGVEIFARLSQELTEIMQEKGYQTIEDFRGKLQYLA